MKCGVRWAAAVRNLPSWRLASVGWMQGRDEVTAGTTSRGGTTSFSSIIHNALHEASREAIARDGTEGYEL